jgi:hypothetical protein
MRSCGHGPPASACWPCVPSSPLLPGVLCSGDVLLSPSSLLRPHAPVSCPPTNFPPRGYIAGLTGARPSLLCIPGLATVPPPLRRRAPPGHPPDSSRRIQPPPSKYRLGAPLSHHCLRASLLGHRPRCLHRASETCTSGQRPACHLLQGAGQRYRGKLGNSPGRTPTGWAYRVAGCTQWV